MKERIRRYQKIHEEEFEKQKKIELSDKKKIKSKTKNFVSSIEFLENLSFKKLKADFNTEFDKTEIRGDIYSSKSISINNTIYLYLLSTEDFETKYNNYSLNYENYRSSEIHMIPLKNLNFDNSGLFTDIETSGCKYQSYKSEDILLIQKYESNFIEDLKTTVSSSLSGATVEELLSEEERENTLPRSFSESIGNPYIVIVEEDEKEFHHPIAFMIKELYREIEEDYPKIIYRLPESIEEHEEYEKVDSFDLHSLNLFSFEKEINILNGRKYKHQIEDFIKSVEGRLISGYLKRFGVLIIVVSKGNGKKIKEMISKRVKGTRILLLRPKNEIYNLLTSRVIGVEGEEDFFEKLDIFNKKIEQTTKKFSIFVNRDVNDKYQYPLKVAVFATLVQENFKDKPLSKIKYEEVLDFIKNSNIETEYEIENIRVDIMYKNKAIEIETLIGSIEPMKKIDETIVKYKDISENKISEIWIVLRPVSTFLHFSDLLNRKKIFEKITGKNVMFKTLVLKNGQWKLLNLEEWISYGKNP